MLPHIHVHQNKTFITGFSQHVCIKILPTHNAHCGLYGGMKYKLLLKALSHAWKLRRSFSS